MYISTKKAPEWNSTNKLILHLIFIKHNKLSEAVYFASLQYVPACTLAPNNRMLQAVTVNSDNLPN